MPRSTNLHPRQCRWLARHSQIALAAVMIQAIDTTKNHVIALCSLGTTKKSCHSLVFHGNSTYKNTTLIFISCTSSFAAFHLCQEPATNKGKGPMSPCGLGLNKSANDMWWHLSWYCMVHDIGRNWIEDA